jgi:DNA invertase Pin-like site-specific DNA recombinase
MKDTAMAGDRAGLLVRVSSGAQDEANQVPDVERHADDRGYRKSKRYTLHDKSAYKGEQQATLDEIVADMRSGIIKVLVVWHSDRIDRRGVLETLTFLRQVRDAGGRIESVQEGLLGERNLITIINAHMNHEKSEHLSEQVQLAHNRIRENQAFRGRDPFGYEITGTKYNKRLVVIESLRPIIEEIFRRVIDGESLADICTWLDSLGVKRAKAMSKKYAVGDITPWWPPMLMRLIRHPAYSGSYYVKRADKSTGKMVSYAHKCEPIVSSRTQREAIAALKTRGRFGTDKRGPRGNPETRAMLKGVITCGNPDCNATGAHPSPMYRLTGRLAGGRAEYYYCQGRGAQRHGCGNLVLMADVDQAVNKIMAETFAVPITEHVLIKGHDWSDEIDAVKDALRDLAGQGLDDDEYDARHAELVAERDRLKALPADPDEWRERELDALWSDEYEATERSGRGAWLRAHGFRVTASKGAVSVVHGHVSRTLTLD